MKKLIILFFISSFGFCQDVNYIKKIDTIYIAFAKKKDLEKNVYTSNYRDYRFYLKTKKNEKKEYLTFEKPDRKNSLTEKGHPRIDVRIEDKSFLKKHKKEIISFDFLKKFEDQYIACELLSDNKILYIIDFTEEKMRKIILYRVHLIYLCPVFE